MMIKFFVPFIYSIETRYAKQIPKGVLLYLLIYLIPQFLLKWCFATECSELIWLLTILLVTDLYEIGYIQNDTETIKKEANPTMRLSQKELAFYEQDKVAIYFSRFLGAFAASIILLCCFGFSSFSILTISIIWLLLPLYYLYNSMRNKWNLLVLHILTSYRCIMPMILCMNDSQDKMWEGIICAYILYPLPTILQQCVMGKFGIKVKCLNRIISNYSERNIFRIRYYAILFLLCVLLTAVRDIEWVYTVLPAYWLMLRIFEYLFYKKDISNSCQSLRQR